MYEAMIKSDKIHTDCILFLINAHERCADLINQKSPKVTGHRRQQVIASILGDHWQLIFRGVALWIFDTRAFYEGIKKILLRCSHRHN